VPCASARAPPGSEVAVPLALPGEAGSVSTPFASSRVSAPVQETESASQRSAAFRNMSIIVRDLEKTYQSAGHPLRILHSVDLDIESGDFVAIIGPSGSGKTTLLGLLAGLDVPTSGSVRIDGQDLGSLTEDQRALFRAGAIGFVFQSFQLLATLTAEENVLVPLELAGRADGEAVQRARELLDRVGLGDRLGHYPAQLSGGEQQRVAIARAFANRPRILFADEPTGNLDADTGARVIELLTGLNADEGSTLVLVTHDPALAQRAHRTIALRSGAVVSDTRRVMSGESVS
jgi:putative ABC transport system ATP-binding protein